MRGLLLLDIEYYSHRELLLMSSIGYCSVLADCTTNTLKWVNKNYLTILLFVCSQLFKLPMTVRLTYSVYLCIRV